jgi:PAS domain S-box-containing protein
MPAPLPPNEAQRLEELRRYALLEAPAEKAFDSITELAARVFKVPISSVTLIDEDREWFKSCVGLEITEMGRHLAFSAHAILSDKVMLVPDARADERFAQHPLVTGPPHVRFYAGAPLKTKNGLNLGTLCIIDTIPRTLDDDASAVLAGLAVRVVAEMELRHHVGKLGRAEESLRLLDAATHQSAECVMITTADLDLPGPEILYVNPAFTRLTGYTAEEALGQTPRMLQGRKTSRPVLDEVRSKLGRGDQFSGEAINYRKDGSEFVVSWNIEPIRNASGTITNFIGFQRDITERQREATERARVAEALQAAKVEAERANLAKSEFLSRMSHELRTPLNAILGFAQLLEHEGQDADDADSVSQIARAGRHLLGLINEVLDLARVEAGKLDLTLEAVNLRDSLEEALSLVRPLAAERHVQLLETAGACDHDVTSSPQHLTQVLLNLLSNAIKFNRHGGSVTITCEKVHGYTRVNITDSGRGLSAAEIEKLFVPFERLGLTHTFEGTGLGLSLSKRLIEAMGGGIGVESAEGTGATFWVELPRVLTSSSALKERLRQRVHVPAESVRLVDPRTVLYIEDNLSNLRLVERILVRRPEVKLLSAMQGSIGLDLARQHQPDLILLDVHLPDMMGDAVLEQLGDDPRTREIPVVILSADATSMQFERMRTLGVQDYLTKPINVAAFLAMIDGARRIQADAVPA